VTDRLRELLRTTSARDHNRAQLVRAVMVEPASQIRLARLTGLSEATVSTIVSELSKIGLLRVTSGPERSRQVQLADVRGVAVGVDLGYTHVSVAARRLDDPELHVATEPVGVERPASAWLEAAVRLFEQVVDESRVDVADTVSVGMGLPGAVDPRTGRMTHRVSAIGSHDEDSYEDPAKTLGKKLGLHVVSDNDANLGAYAEYLVGAGRDAETLFYVKASRGVGAGIVVGGNIFRGKDGIAGELGHVSLDRSGTVCKCGSRGCLETAIGEVQLLEQVRQAYAGRSIQIPRTLDALIERARLNEAVELRVLQDAGRTLGFALAQVCNLLDPDRIVIGGRLGQAIDRELLIGPAEEELRRYALPGARNIPIQPTQLGGEAQLRGALYLGLRSHELATA
jgi:predicted NBD/HSP70 family sugar kinase